MGMINDQLWHGFHQHLSKYYLKNTTSNPFTTILLQRGGRESIAIDIVDLLLILLLILIKIIRIITKRLIRLYLALDIKYLLI